MITLKGAAVSAKIKEQVETLLTGLKGKTPKLAIVRVGERPDDLSYERGALKKMESFGLMGESFAFPQDITDEAFKKEFAKINENPDIDGILLLRPLPKQIKEKDIEHMIDPEKIWMAYHQKILPGYLPGTIPDLHPARRKRW